MECLVKSKESHFIELEYLPRELLKSFAKSYSLSFPELELGSPTLITFLERKFQIFENSSFHNIAALISDNGLVASGYGMVRSSYSQGKQDLNVALVCDVFTNPRFRKMGLFKKVSLVAIDREKLTKTNFLIGFLIRDEVMPGHLSVGWKYVFNMPLWWGFPRLGWLKDFEKKPDLNSSMFDVPKSKVSIKVNDEYLKWRFSYHNVNYYLISIPNSKDFAIVRKAKLRKIPFTCVVFMQSTNESSTRILVHRIQRLAFRLGTFGVLGCWNESYANDLFLSKSGLRKSSKFQKVIVRELNGFRCPNDEKDYRLSWIDSDTL